MNLRKVDTQKHTKIFSDDLNIASNPQSYLIKKLLNQSNSKRLNTDTIENENLGNFKINIQNIFANDDKKKKAIKYVIQLRRDRNKSPFLQKEDYYTLNKDLQMNNNKSQINMTGYNNTLDYNFDDLYNRKTLNRNKIKNNESNDYSQRRKTENISNKDNNDYYIKSNIFVENKNLLNFHHNKIKSNNNLLRNYQNYGLYNKNEKNYNAMKLKNKILNIPIQDIRYSKNILKNPNQNQTLFNTQINFNYNTNKKYYVHKNLVYPKMNNPINRTSINELNSKSLLVQNRAKQRKIPINNAYNNNLINNNINIEKVFNQKTLIKIKAIYFSIYPGKKKEKINKSLIIFSKDKLIQSNRNELQLINDNKNKFQFNFKDEKEMFNYIKNKYDNKMIKKMLDLRINEEILNNLKEENKNLNIEIQNLKNENEQCKIELNDIRNQYNDLNRELNITKEENEKLKDNFINDMIEEDKNSVNDD